MKKTLLITTLFMGALGLNSCSTTSSQKPNASAKKERVQNQFLSRQSAYLKSLDQNQDKELSAKEVGAESFRVFKQVDSNKDGVINSKDRHYDRIPKMRRTLDKNQDGRITRVEFKRMFSKWIYRYDQNGDKKIENEEYSKPAKIISNKKGKNNE